MPSRYTTKRRGRKFVKRLGAWIGPTNSKPPTASSSPTLARDASARRPSYFHARAALPSPRSPAPASETRPRYPAHASGLPFGRSPAHPELESLAAAVAVRLATALLAPAYLSPLRSALLPYSHQPVSSVASPRR